MKEKPILMSAPMVRAILEGRKMQTRRVVKFEINSFTGKHGEGFKRFEQAIDGLHWIGQLHLGDSTRGVKTTLAGESVKCPYGKIKDRLWVRETFAVMNQAAFKSKRPSPFSLRYKTDSDTAHTLRFRPSIFMPRWASRITLEIVNVRVERLRDISTKDAEAEGVQYAVAKSEEHPEKVTPPIPLTGPCVPHFQKLKDITHDSLMRANYAGLWDSIYGKKFPWSSNPWVWVIEFKRLP